MEIGCIIQARMGSTRLPGKVLEELEEGKTCLDSVIQQLEDVFDKKNIVIATTNLEEDKIIEQFCKEREINVFKGETKRNQIVVPMSDLMNRNMTMQNVTGGILQYFGCTIL